MNPYDFVRPDWNNRPRRRQPIWHHRLVGVGTQKLYSGQIEVDVIAETPIFISDPHTTSPDPEKPAQFIQNRHGQYILPSSSLKGLLRTVVETLGNGCFTLFDGNYERDTINYTRYLPDSFQQCENNTELCISCRIFGMLKEGARGIFLGKVNIGDAVADPDQIYEYQPMYTGILSTPKPHHADFYLDAGKKHISGRKYYFHHSRDVHPIQEEEIRYTRAGVPQNRYIQPLDYDTKFHFRVDFTSIEGDEFAALLLAICLEDGMRHKIGYGKPLGLGSIRLIPTKLTLVDYATRYTQLRTERRGMTVLEGDALSSLLDQHIADFSRTHLCTIAMDDLRRIWRWPPNPNVDYYYPSKRDWFNTPHSRGKRIADTRNVP